MSWEDYWDDEDDAEPAVVIPLPLDFARMAQLAQSRLARALSVDVARHLREMARGRLPEGTINFNTERHCESDRVMRYDGRTEFFPTFCYTLATLRCTLELAEEFSRAYYNQNSLGLERFGAAGSWRVIHVERSRDVQQYSEATITFQELS